MSLHHEEVTLTHPSTVRITTALNECIEACIDGEKTYGLAAADARDPSLKALFSQFEKYRADFSMALQSLVQQLGLFPLNEGTTLGAATRLWTGFVRVARGRDDRLILEQCLRAERHTMEMYANAFRDPVFRDGPADLRAMIEAQFSSCRMALAELERRLDGTVIASAEA